MFIYRFWASSLSWLGRCIAGYQLKVCVRERGPFTVTAPSVLWALKDFRELIYLPQLFLLQCCLFAHGSSWAPGFKKLCGCCLGGFMFDYVRAAWPLVLPWQGACYGRSCIAEGDQVSAIKSLLPRFFSSLLLSLPASRPSTSTRTPLLFVLDRLLSFDPLSLKIKERLCYVNNHRQQEFHC